MSTLTMSPSVSVPKSACFTLLPPFLLRYFSGWCFSRSASSVGSRILNLLRVEPAASQSMGLFSEILAMYALFGTEEELAKNLQRKDKAV